VTTTDGIAGGDTHQIAVTVNAPVVTTLPTPLLIQGFGNDAPIAGISLADADAGSANELITVTLKETRGLSIIQFSADTSAPGGGGTITGSGTGQLTISGSLAQVNADLSTLAVLNTNVFFDDSLDIRTDDGRGGGSDQTFPFADNGQPFMPLLGFVNVLIFQAAVPRALFPLVGFSVIDADADFVGETITVEISDSEGILTASALGAGDTVSGSGTTQLSISGTIAEVNADLPTVVYSNPAAGTDGVDISISDGRGGSSGGQIAIKIDAPPVTTVPSGPFLLQAGQATAIPGISIADPDGPIAGSEVVLLSDTTGLLAANANIPGGGGVINETTLKGNGLHIGGSLAQVNADLTTLTYTAPNTLGSTTFADTLDVTTNDGFAVDGPHGIPIIINYAPRETFIVSGPFDPANGHVGELQQGEPASVIEALIGDSDTEAGGADEAFAVTVTASAGALTIGAAFGSSTISGSGTGQVTITGSLGDVNADLATLGYVDSDFGQVQLEMFTSDGRGGSIDQVLSVRINAPPIVTAGPITMAAEIAAAVPGLSISDGDGNAELLEVTLTAASGLLSAPATSIFEVRSGARSITIQGSRDEVNAALSGLTYFAALPGQDHIDVAVNDNHDGTDDRQIGVNVAPYAGSDVSLTTGADQVAGSPAPDRVLAANGTLSSGDSIDAGGHVLELVGPGQFDLTQPASLTNVGFLVAHEGQAGFIQDGGGSKPGTAQTVVLRDGLDLVMDVLDGTADPTNPNPETILIQGAHNADVINLGGGNDVVVVGDSAEAIHGGSGAATIRVTAATADAFVDGGTSGRSVLEVQGGGTVRMGSEITNIATVILDPSAVNYDFLANHSSGLVVDDESGGNDTLRAGGAGQVLTGGTPGHLTMFAALLGSTTFRDTCAEISGDQIVGLDGHGNVLDLTDLNPGSVTGSFSVNQFGTVGTVQLTDGTHSASLQLLGQFAAAGFSGSLAAAGFSVAPDGSGGSNISHPALFLTSPP
jgi:hypothetical protein